jgi:urease accessory protein
VGADLDLIRQQAPEHRRGKPILYTNCKTGEGLDRVRDFILETVLFQPVKANNYSSLQDGCVE